MDVCINFSSIYKDTLVAKELKEKFQVLECYHEGLWNTGDGRVQIDGCWGFNPPVPLFIPLWTPKPPQLLSSCCVADPPSSFFTIWNLGFGRRTVVDIIYSKVTAAFHCVRLHVTLIMGHLLEDACLVGRYKWSYLAWNIFKLFNSTLSLSTSNALLIRIH